MAKAAVKEATFLWQGTNREGSRVKGQMQSFNDSLVKVQLRKQGINPISVRKKSELFGKRKKKIESADIAIFSRQMATMMQAGVPLVQALDIVGLAYVRALHLIAHRDHDIGDARHADAANADNMRGTKIKRSGRSHAGSSK